MGIFDNLTANTANGSFLGGGIDTALPFFALANAAKQRDQYGKQNIPGAMLQALMMAKQIKEDKEKREFEKRYREMAMKKTEYEMNRPERIEQFLSGAAGMIPGEPIGTEATGEFMRGAPQEISNRELVASSLSNPGLMPMVEMLLKESGGSLPGQFFKQPGEATRMIPVTFPDGTTREVAEKEAYHYFDVFGKADRVPPHYNVVQDKKSPTGWSYQNLVEPTAGLITGAPVPSSEKPEKAEKATDYDKKWARAKGAARKKLNREPSDEETAEKYKEMYGTDNTPWWVKPPTVPTPFGGQAGTPVNPTVKPKF